MQPEPLARAMSEGESRVSLSTVLSAAIPESGRRNSRAMRTSWESDMLLGIVMLEQGRGSGGTG